MRNRKRVKAIVPILLLLVLAVSLLVIFGLVEKIFDRMTVPPASLAYSDSGEQRVLYNDAWYLMDDRVETLLVLGIDSLEMPDGTGGDSDQADFIALLVIDRGRETFRILHINRDTMTDIQQLDAEDQSFDTFNAQLALAHTYGSEGKIKCRNTVDAVENLLYGIDIDHYLSMTMDVVPILNDSIGGVTVSLTEDLPALGEDFVKDAQITLHGEQALSFVRWRSDAAESSNLERMERQRQYIGALFDRYTALDPDSTLETMMKVNAHLVSDCTVDQITNLLERLQKYTYEGVLTLAGEAVKTDVYVEYHIDETAAQATVIDLFYKPEEKNE